MPAVPSGLMPIYPLSMDTKVEPIRTLRVTLGCPYSVTRISKDSHLGMALQNYIGDIERPRSDGDDIPASQSARPGVGSNAVAALAAGLPASTSTMMMLKRISRDAQRLEEKENGAGHIEPLAQALGAKGIPSLITKLEND